MSLRETAENLVEFARHSKQEELDNVVMAIVNFAQEQRLEILQELLTILKSRKHEAIVSKRQRQEIAKFSERKTI